MPEIIFTASYEKRVKKFLKQHPNLKNQYIKSLKLLAANPNHPSLRLHRLKGRLSAFYSASINDAYRISLQFIVKKDSIIPVNVGKHDEVY